MERGSSADLYANNVHSRTSFGRHMKLAIKPADLEPDYFFVTLALDRYTFPCSQASRYDPQELKDWASALFSEFDFIAIVEWGYFGNFKFGRGPHKPALSMHVHMNVWGCSEKHVKQVTREINRSQQSAIPGRPAAHYRCLSREEFIGRALYMSKVIISELRIYAKKTKVRDTLTGATAISSRRYKSRKRALGPIDWMRAVEALADRKIPDLTFANRAGEPILERALLNTRRELERTIREHREKLRALLS